MLVVIRHVQLTKILLCKVYTEPTIYMLVVIHHVQLTKILLCKVYTEPTIYMLVVIRHVQLTKILLCKVYTHRRIQDFVRGGGQGPLGPRGGAKALLARASLFRGAIFCGEGGGAKAPVAPPLDPRMILNRQSTCWL